MVTCKKQALENDLLNRNMSCHWVIVSFVVETEKLESMILLLEGSQAMTTRPFDNDKVRVKALGW
jgi:hypothetical protein